jgi:hypothetical protein
VYYYVRSSSSSAQLFRGFVRKPSLASLAIGLVPFAALCFGVPLWDRIYPRVFGLPFNVFWLSAWIVLTPAFMSCAYKIESRRQHGATEKSDRKAL